MITACRDAVPHYVANLRRLMAREGLTLTELIRRSRLNHRTLKEMLAGRRRPQPRTLHRLAGSLNVPVEELFQDPALLRHRLFDRHTNPVVDEVVAAYPQMFHGWTSAEFDELYSRFGTGGSLTREGTLDAVRAMNRRRELLAKATLLLETSEAEFLESILELLYRRAVLTAPDLADSKKPYEVMPAHETPAPQQSKTEITQPPVVNISTPPQPAPVVNVQLPQPAAKPPN